MSRTKAMIAAALTFYLALIVTEKVQAGVGFQPMELLVDLAETVFLFGAVWMTAQLSAETRDMRRERTDLLRDLAQARGVSDHWRRAARSQVEGLSRAIAGQFRDWSLTEAEADVAGLMLKGLSHKEIAHLRGNSEATVRQHAATVYRKSGLAGRTQLTAFFLEDLLQPAPKEVAADAPVITLPSSGRTGR